MKKSKLAKDSVSESKIKNPANVRGSIKVAGVEIFDGEDVTNITLIRNGFQITIRDMGIDDDEESSSSSTSFTD